MDTNTSYGLRKKAQSYVLGFPYNPSLVEESRNLGTSKYDPITKTRTYSLHSLPRLIEFCEKHDLPVDDAARAMLEKAQSLKQVVLHKGGMKVRLLPGLEPPKPIEFGKTKDWYYIPSAYLTSALKWAEENDLTIEEDVYTRVKNQFSEEMKNYSRGTSLNEEPLEIIGLKSSPLPLQWVPAHVIEDNKVAILADEQGLGKTLESLMTARIESDPAQRLVIICPDSLSLNWTTEMEVHFEEGTFHPTIAKSRTPKPIDDEYDTVIIGWSILSYWVDTLVAWKPDMVISDEGHYAKAGKVSSKVEEEVIFNDKGEITTQKVQKKVGGSYRGSAKDALFNAVANGGKLLDLTGTPMPQKPKELQPALQALNIDGHFGNSQYYNMRYCDGQLKYIGGGRGPRGDGYVWDFSGASNLLELNTRMLSSGHYIRRTKQHLVDSGMLPKKYVDGVYFYDLDHTPEPTFIDGDEEVMKEYVKLEYGLTQELAQLAEYHARKLRVPINHPNVLKKLTTEANKRKNSLFQLRRLAGMAAIPSVLKQAKLLVDQGEKVMIIAHHRDVVDAYVDAFPGASKIQGGMGTKKIEEEKARFNAAGFDTPVMVLAIEAGKTGHTLCKQPDKKCAYGLIAEQPWTPSDEHQGSDRIWRLGQDREVTIRNLLVRSTVHEDIYRNRKAKERSVLAAIDGLTPSGEVTERSGLGEMALNLAKKGLEG